MKALNIFSIVIILSIITIFSSCSKDSEIEPENVEILGTMQAEIGGISFEVYELTSPLGILFGSDDKSWVRIEAHNCPEEKTISLTIPTEIGTYQFEEWSHSGYSVKASLDDGPCMGQKIKYKAKEGEGHVTINNSSEEGISGTFNFTGKNDFDNIIIYVRNGTFDFKYSENCCL